MRLRLFSLALIGLGAIASISVAVAQDPTCEPTPERHAVRILGTGMDGELTDQEFPYVAGARSFFRPLDNGWVFALMRAENGWSIRLYEHERIGEAVDLTAMTPPLRGVPNPRDIFGWHFRNADNTGPNQGDVNAPQDLRAFIITPSLAGTGGYKPPKGDTPAPAPSPEDGIGWLKVLDYGLANPVPGQRARMNYLKFDACLAWPRGDDERDAMLDAASLDYTDEDKEAFGSCGLDLWAMELDARYTPRTLGGDMDGDGALDEVAQIHRLADGRRGIALCRAGTWLDLIGMEDTPEGLRPGYVDQTEAWQWVSPGGDIPAHLQGYDLPSADGDMLVLERIEKEAVLIYWKDGTLKAQHVYHHVEPDAQ